MLSKEDLVRIVKDEVEKLVKKGEKPIGNYYVLLNGKIYPIDKFEEEVEAGVLTAEDIYAYAKIYYEYDFDVILFIMDYYLDLNEIVKLYLRKEGFTIIGKRRYSPTPNLKYYIFSVTKLDKYGHPEYLISTIYDFDTIAKGFNLSQTVKQELSNKSSKTILEEDVEAIANRLNKEQPILAGNTYWDIFTILENYFVFHKEEYKKEATKLALAFAEQFPISYRACYKWNKKAGMFVGANCLTITFHSSSS